MPRYISAQVDDTTYENFATLRLRLSLSTPEVLALMAREFVDAHAVALLEGPERDRLRPRGALTPEQEAEREAQGASYDNGRL